MKRIVRGNDFTMRIPVVKIVDGEKVAFPLPGCTDIVVRLCSAYRRLELAYTIDAKEDNVIVARVEGDRIPLGTYALEVRGKIFGNDWRSNEYEQVAIVDRNADADTELGNTDEGEDSVEMDTAVVVLPPDRELDALVKEAQAQNKAMSELSDAIKASEEGRTKSEELRAKSEESRVQAELTRVSQEAERVQAEQVRESGEGQRVGAEQERASAENARVTAESARVTAENTRASAENKRAQSEQSRETAETDRANAEKARAAAETARAAAETQRIDAETQRETAFSSAKEACEAATSNATAAADKANTATSNANSATETATEAETERQDAEDARKEAETARVEAENARVTAEDARADAENARVTAENARVTAESARVTAEGEREQGFTEKAAHLEELLQYIKDNHLEPDAKLAEAIKNTINGTDEFVYLDTNDGNVKSMPNTNKLGANVASVYYAGKRSIGLGEKCQIFSARNTLVRNLDLSGWDFEAATSMSSFLEGASALKTLTLPDNMTLSHIDSMYSAFDGCTSLRELDTSKWTLENVTNMNNCFWGCASLKSLDMSKCTLENVTGMNNCLRDCASLKSLDMSKCTLENVTDIGQCFRGLSLLQELNLSSCNITKCRNWYSWILSDKNLETLRIGLIDFSPCGDVNFLDGTNIRVLTGTLRGIKNNFMATSNRMTRDSCMVVINGLEMVTEAKTLTLGVNNKPVSLGGKGSDPISDDDLKVATDKGWTVQFA